MAPRSSDATTSCTRAMPKAARTCLATGVICPHTFSRRPPAAAPPGFACGGVGGGLGHPEPPLCELFPHALRSVFQKVVAVVLEHTLSLGWRPNAIENTNV